MKKAYTKPTLQIERFEMDIEILATVIVGSPLYNQLHDEYERLVKYEGAPAGDAAFTAWVQSQGYDTPTSGLCYFTPTQPS